MRFTLLLLSGVCLPVLAAAQQGPPGQTSRPGWPCAGNVDPAYVQVSEATGGKVLVFHPSELEGVVADERASRQHRETVFRAAGQLSGDLYELPIPIDSTIESAYFSVSVQCLQTVTLMTPSGQELAIGAGGVEYHQFESIRLFVVSNPAPGMWKLVAAGNGFFSAIVSARTDLRLVDVTLTDHDAALNSAPATSLEATLTGPLRQAGFHFVRGNGSPIVALSLSMSEASPDVREYGGFVTRPHEHFRVAVSGIDANGFQFQRMEGRLMPGQPVSR